MDCRGPYAVYEKSELMAADSYTKGLNDKATWRAVFWLISVVHVMCLSGMPSYDGEFQVRSKEEEEAKVLAKVSSEAAAKVAPVANVLQSLAQDLPLPLPLGADTPQGG